MHRASAAINIWFYAREIRALPLRILAAPSALFSLLLKSSCPTFPAFLHAGDIRAGNNFAINGRAENRCGSKSGARNKIGRLHYYE